jgi:hypothetical protein
MPDVRSQRSRLVLGRGSALGCIRRASEVGRRAGHRRHRCRVGFDAPIAPSNDSESQIDAQKGERLMWMMTVEGDYVNLDHVVRIKSAVTAKHEQAFVLRMVDGESARVTVPANADLGTMLGTILPAQPGQEVLLVNYDTIGELPTENDVWFTRVPVLGWRDADPSELLGLVVPILPGGITSSSATMLVLPGGRLMTLDADATEYESIDAMRAAFLGRAQREWTSNRSKSASATEGDIKPAASP